MAIETKVLNDFVLSKEPGKLIGTVVVRIDESVEAMQIDIVFADRGARAANEAEAIKAAKTLARRFADSRAESRH